MNNDFKKGFSIGAGIFAALLIPTAIYFISSNVLKNNEKNKAYKAYYAECIEKISDLYLDDSLTMSKEKWKFLIIETCKKDTKKFYLEWDAGNKYPRYVR